MIAFLIEGKRDENPKWLGDLKIERTPNGELVFLALSSKGSEKYEWRIPEGEMVQSLRLLGVDTNT